jgi:tRNA(Arg) A34 adenosine deaminase TadA
MSISRSDEINISKAEIDSKKSKLSISRSDEINISKAAIEATKSELSMKHGCVLVKKGKIVGKGHNSYRTRSKDKFIENTCACHAEIDAIRQYYRTASTRPYENYWRSVKGIRINENIFKNIVLYVVRQDAWGNFKNSAPCKSCLKVILKLKIKKIIFSIDDNNFHVCRTHDYETEHISVGNRWLLGYKN